MARVKMTHDHIVHATPSISVHYSAGSEVAAPRAHIEEIVAAGHGERVDGPDDDAAAAETGAG